MARNQQCFSDDRCTICGRKDRLVREWFRVKQPRSRFGRSMWTPWRHDQAPWVEEFLGLNIVGSGLLICCFCLKSIRMWVDATFKLYRHPNTEHEIAWNSTLFKVRSSRAVWELGCVSAIASYMGRSCR